MVGGMRRRIASVWLTELDADIAARRDPVWRTAPLAFFRESGGRLLLTAANNPAVLEGVLPGMTLADGRARLADLAVLPEDPATRARMQKALRRWFDRFSPHVGPDGDNGFFLDMTGAARLFGGERPFLDDLLARLRRLGFACRAALADTPGAAWALARYGAAGMIAPTGKAKDAIHNLPIAALRLAPGTVERLRRLGLVRIDDLLALPRPALTRRFGLALVRRLDQALGAAAEPITPERLIAPCQTRLSFAEPLTTEPALQEALARLIERLVSQLASADLGALGLTFTVERMDGQRQSLFARAAEPTRDKQRLARLYAERLATIDPGFGIEAATLAAPETAALHARQRAAFGPATAPDALSQLVDRLGGRIGFDAVARFAPRDRWQPDRSFWLQPTGVDGAEAASPDDWPDAMAPPRPLLLLNRPEPVQADAPDDALAPPAAIRRAGRWRRLRQAEGPERILPEWRIRDPAWPAARDYWRAEEEDGARIWLYRERYQERDRWFLHGFFP